MNPAREKTEYFLTKGFFYALRYCPAPMIYGTCRLIARFLYLMGRGRRHIAIKNLQIAYPEKSKREQKRIAREAYDHFGRMIAESAMILAGKINREKLLAMVDGEQMSKLLELEASTDKGILFITGHLGNFELLAHYTGMLFKRQGHVVARRGNNRLIDDRIVTPMRESFGNRVIHKRRALPRITRALKSGGHAGLLIDVKTNPRHGISIQFFGKKTLGLKSSAYLQIKLNPLVIPMSLVMNDNGRYRLVVSDPITWQDNGQPLEDQVAELAQKHHTALEKLIRQYPGQWLWMHNRWKLS
jgi:KDO2-lipid IV(A) lauroyltransferase